VDALTTAEHVLAKMMEAISGDSAPGGQANAAGFDEVRNASVYGYMDVRMFVEYQRIVTAIQKFLPFYYVVTGWQPDQP